VPTGAAIAAVIADAYGLGPLDQCRLFARGLNDTYAFVAGGERYVFRLYRRGWRSTDDVRFERELVEHVAARGARVSTPVARRDGGSTTWVDAPEGRRIGVLFSHAAGEGYELRRKGGDENAERYGAAVARLHDAAEGFACDAPRFALDARHLIEEPIAGLRPWLRDRPDDARYLEAVGDFLRDRIEQAAPTLEYGVCHGDLHGGNAHLDQELRLTLFDFDCCGMGHRAYELAVFRWNAVMPGQAAGTSSTELWDRFLIGYRRHRAIGEADLAATALYVPARHIWWMGIRALNADSLGSAQWLDRRFFDEHLGLIAAWCANHVADAPAWVCARG
jgi:Ser/Thr protein kinase RdoA (MazF antagonist)